jgi:exodeoxyribonuclease III
VNVNGVRAASRHGGLSWLAEQQADIIALQEVRATTAQLVTELAASPLADWQVAHTESAAKGRAGVAIISKVAPLEVRLDCLTSEFRDSGRWLEADFAVDGGQLTVASVYVPSGEAKTPKQDEKYRFLVAMEDRLKVLAERSHSLILGDLNVAHQEQDLKNWKGNLKKAGFLPEERAYFDRWLAAESPWVDVHRNLHGPGPGPYSWWSMRGQAFDNDAGWRIDYHLATSKLATQASAAVVGRAASYDTRWSDHAAVMVDYRLNLR